MANQHIIIPARYNSSRLPGKLMADLAGKPLIAHTIETAKAMMTSVIVATDHKVIYDFAIALGVDAVMTSLNHNSGTDRLAEVVTNLNFNEDDIVINLQGDEPLMPISLLNQVAQLLETDHGAGIATLIQPINTFTDFINPNIVKVAMGESNKAQYFSRAPIPYPRDEFSEGKRNMPKGNFYRHLGLYAYRVKTLKHITHLPEHPLEALEKLEQLRPLAHGIKIIAEIAREIPPHGVDTQEDLDRIRSLLQY
jgi:3-deoxy-manno-octulosonate cytidylyltransferase (CMP-KDO synthetase)